MAIGIGNGWLNRSPILRQQSELSYRHRKLKFPPSGCSALGLRGTKSFRALVNQRIGRIVRRDGAGIIAVLQANTVLKLSLIVSPTGDRGLACLEDSRLAAPVDDNESLRAIRNS